MAKKKTAQKKGTTHKSKKIAWWKKVPILSGMVASFALFILCGLTIVDAHTSVLGAKAVSTQVVKVTAIASTGKSFTFPTEDNGQFCISQEGNPTGSICSSTLPISKQFVIKSGKSIVGNYGFTGKIPAIFSNIKMSANTISYQDQVNCIKHNRVCTMTVKVPTFTCSSKGGTCVSTGVFKFGKMSEINGTCPPRLICATKK